MSLGAPSHSVVGARPQRLGLCPSLPAGRAACSLPEQALLAETCVRWVCADAVGAWREGCPVYCGWGGEGGCGRTWGRPRGEAPPLRLVHGRGRRYPRDTVLLMAGPCGYVTFRGRRDFADVVKGFERRGSHRIGGGGITRVPEQVRICSERTDSGGKGGDVARAKDVAAGRGEETQPCTPRF